MDRSEILEKLARSKKKFYKMGEVCEMLGLESHVLRFWENEFDQLDPRKNRSGHRIYAPADIEQVLEIRELVHEQGFTLAGAQRQLDMGPEGLSGELSNDQKTKVLSEIRAVRRILRDALKKLDAP